MPVLRVCLLIDDDIDDQEIFALALDQVSDRFQCRVANNAFEALKQLLNSPGDLPDFIFLDLNMPRMNGRECLAEIKSHEQLRHIPVIIYSTSSLQDDIIQTRKLGAAGFITKPSSIQALSLKLLEVFQAHRVNVPVGTDKIAH